jgi:hypothetical protein
MTKINQNNLTYKRIFKLWRVSVSFSQRSCWRYPYSVDRYPVSVSFSTGELLFDVVIGNYVLEMYESQLNFVSEKEVYLMDEEIKKKMNKIRKKMRK